MFLSQLTLHPRSRDALRDLRDPYDMHRTLTRAWGDACTEARILFRVEEDKGDAPIVLVQATLAPAWDKLPIGYLQRAAQTKEWEPHFHEGQPLRFRLVANPTFAAKPPGTTDGTRRGLFREAERLDWLRRQSETHGFELPLCPVTLRPPGAEGGHADSSENPRSVTFRGREFPELQLELPTVQVVDLNDGHRFTMPTKGTHFSAARFEGTLRVTNAAKFTRAVECGIGKARGFGFGLLSVARA